MAMVNPAGATTAKKAKSRRKSNLASESVPTQKAGNQGNLHGPYKAFLKTFIESYFTAVKTKKTPQFWGLTYLLFHPKFDWHFSLADLYPEDHTFSLEVDDTDLDEASVTLKKERVEGVNKVCSPCLYTHR